MTFDTWDPSDIWSLGYFDANLQRQKDIKTKRLKIPNGQNNLLCQKLVSADISEVGQGRGPVSGSRILFASKFGTGFLQNDKKPFHKAAKMVFYKQQNLPKFKGALEEEKQAVS